MKTTESLMISYTPDEAMSRRGPGGEPMLAIMLRSLLVQEPVEKSNYGGKAA